MAERRPRRERDEEVLVWPDLVFVEFISAVLFLILLLGLSTAINAVLLDEANSNITPNPSKAPWYFLNLQELLLHMHPALAGVVVPTVALILLAAIPYIDRSNEGQGVWWGGHEHAVEIVLFSIVYTFVILVLLILYDAGTQDKIYNAITGGHLPLWLQSTAGLQQGINWPSWTLHIPYLPHDLHLYGTDFLNLNFPAWLVQQAIPLACMIGFPVLLIFVLRFRYGPLGTRGIMYALFTGFMTTYVVLTIVGTAFRGEGMALLPPWSVHPPTGLGVD
jgi:menaquinol-cytochrome c reductase cytochrome b/c subunit